MKRRILATVLVLGLIALVRSVPGGVAAAPTILDYTASAYGTSAYVGSTVKAGQSAVVGLPCGAQPGVHGANTVASTNVSPLLSIGTINTTVAASDLGEGATSSQATAGVQKVSLLGGRVTADAINAVSTTTHNAFGFHTSAAGTAFTNLHIAGVLEVSDNPAPNTTVAVPGFGSATLNEQVALGSSYLAVTALDISVTLPNVLGIATGTHIIVAFAASSMNAAVRAGTVTGYAYGSQVLAAGNTLTSGPSAYVYLPCQGTNGQVRTNSIASLNISPILSAGTATTTAQGTSTATLASSETTATVQNVNLLGGLVTVAAIKADAHASTNGTTPTTSDSGSTFTTLRVAGHPELADNPAPFTRVSLAGIGTVILHQVYGNGASTSLIMLEIDVAQTNTFGLPIGSRILLGVASAGTQ